MQIMETGEIIFVLLLGIFVIGAFLVYFSMFLVSLLDDISIAIFEKPLYVHLYLFPKKISEEEQLILRQKFTFYKTLSDKQRKYFHHRISVFNKFVR